MPVHICALILTCNTTFSHNVQLINKAASTCTVCHEKFCRFFLVGKRDYKNSCRSCYFYTLKEKSTMCSLMIFLLSSICENLAESACLNPLLPVIKVSTKVSTLLKMVRYCSITVCYFWDMSVK